MVYGFVKQSGGHIKVYSEEGHGTTFKIYLPHADVLAEPMPMRPPPPDRRRRGDDPGRRGRHAGAQFRHRATPKPRLQDAAAANAAEALAIADGGAQFDLLFTDVIMPGKMNGRQLAEEMAKRRSPLKVLFTSGYTENAIIHHGRLDPGVLLLPSPTASRNGPAAADCNRCWRRLVAPGHEPANSRPQSAS